MNLYTRRLQRGNGIQKLHRAGTKMTEMYFVTEGAFALHCTEHADPKRPHPPFMILPPGKIYGDYQVLFDLYANFDFQTYIYDFRFGELNEKLNLNELEVEEYVAMCLSAEKLQYLCELYP